MNARDTREQAGVVVQDFTSADDAVRTIQGLKSVGFAERDIDVVAQDDVLEQSIREQAFPHEPEGPLSRLGDAISSLTHRLIHHGVAEQHAWEYSGKVEAGHILVAVAAGGRSQLARDVMHDGLAYTGHMHATQGHHPYLDSSTGSGAGVATSTGAATGITPGSGYEGNTGSSTESSAGVLGQFAPGADTANPSDDFLGHEAHVEGDWPGMIATEANALDYDQMTAGDDAIPDGDSPTEDVAPEGSVDDIEDNIFNTGSGSTGNPILDMSVGTTAGVTPSIDTLIGIEEGEGYTEPEGAPDDDDDEDDE